MQLSHTRSAAAAVFDDPNLVSCAGLVPVVALAEQAGLRALADEHLTVTLPMRDPWRHTTDARGSGSRRVPVSVGQAGHLDVGISTVRTVQPPVLCGLTGGVAVADIRRASLPRVGK